MKVKLRTKHIRARITLWHTSVLGLTLVLYSVGVSGLLLWQLQKQLGTHAIQDLETVEGLLFFSRDGELRLREDYYSHPESRLVQERLLEVLSSDGEVLFKNDRLGNRSLGGPPFVGEGQGGYSERLTRLQDGTPVTLVSRQHVLDGRRLLIRLAYSEYPIRQRFEELLIAMLIGLPVALGFAGLTGYWIANRALAPIGEITQLAAHINGERLNTRLPNESEDEVGQLARVFNEMLARLEYSFEQVRRFTSDASHELRTPLASIRSVGEVGLQKDRSREEYREIIGSMLEETNRLTQLVENLLTLSRADAGQIRLQTSVIPVVPLLRDSADLLGVLMEEKRQRLVLEGNESARVVGDPVFLRQAFLNVLHNAIKYSSPEGTIQVLVEVDKRGCVAVLVKDSGPGVPPEHREKVFDRFYRIDQGRTRDSGGTGLGLAIAKWIVHAHGGEIHLVNAAGGGSVFSIHLPSAQTKAATSQAL